MWGRVRVVWVSCGWGPIVRGIMQRVSRTEIEACCEEYDAAVALDAALDPFCSSSRWLLPYHDAFDFDRPLWCGRSDNSWVWLAERRVGVRTVCLEPLENMWGFGCPLVGPGAAALLARYLVDRPTPVLLLGLPMDSARIEPLAHALGAERWRSRTLEPTTRFVASLAGGVEGWASRRSARFLRNLRADLRQVEGAGIRFRRVHCGPGPELAALYERILAIEGRAWKSLEGRGADSEPMRSFYDHAWHRLAEQGQLRVLLAESQGRELGYLHGALVDGRFRGLQFSFDEAVRSLGLGNALQYQMLDWLCELGAADYDMGSHSEYKRRWAEPGLTTFGLVLHPPS